MSTDRPALKIEITPEMIDAGARALMSYRYDYTSYEDGARHIFEAMITVSSSVTTPSRLGAT